MAVLNISNSSLTFVHLLKLQFHYIRIADVIATCVLQFKPKENKRERTPFLRSNRYQMLDRSILSGVVGVYISEIK